MKYLKRFTVVLLVAALILSTAGIAGAAPSDVAGTRYAESVEYLRNLGVLAGYPDGTIKPEATITRAEAVKIIIVATYGSETLANLMKGATPFSDVLGTPWASGFIALAKNAGIVDGYPD
ncbi:MAG: S-layer homology domain-containing protein, partial [Bacillota bacterium]|nr:S-layer homology domain-containing protein [Bacillota bacterium]